MAFQLYESNGILKRNEVNDIVRKITKDERRQLNHMGIKIGRYHMFLPKMLKQDRCIRILLWRFHNEINKNSRYPNLD